MMNEPISKIMITKVVTVSPDDKLTVVKEILFNKRFHHIPVVKGPKNRLVGIITSYDIFKLNRKFEEYDSITVREIMTKKIATLRPEEAIGAAAQVFLRHLFHGMPIVNEDQELVGIITTHDILRYNFDKEYPNDEFEIEWRHIEEGD
ncbi:MAG: CBS domain-containing protein [Saprospirales bacterium]|nr:CBS domain-containing protein [Saprospirales bacterium]MBK8490592.1 CBS domain-containing protein [Saprospirales bacterium]